MTDSTSIVLMGRGGAETEVAEAPTRTSSWPGEGEYTPAKDTEALARGSWVIVEGEENPAQVLGVRWAERGETSRGDEGRQYYVQGPGWLPERSVKETEAPRGPEPMTDAERDELLQSWIDWPLPKD